MTHEGGAQTSDEYAYLNARMLELEQRVEELSLRVGNLVELVARLSHDADSSAQPLTVSEDAAAAAATAEPAAGSAEAAQATPAISRGMLRVIQRIQHGDGETAQQELQALPQQELASQPAVVALVAAALFVQRGDLKAGLKALRRARGLTDDPRLLKLISLLEEQSS